MDTIAAMPRSTMTAMSLADAPSSKMIADNVRRLRKEKKWSQARLAQEAGLSRGAIATLETSVYAYPETETLIRISTSLGVSISELTGEDAPPVTQELTEFLGTPQGKTATALEIDELRRFPLSGKRATRITYELMLMALRSRF
jgi:transcriptional regulator with XRE-family HTH domain